MDHARIPKAEAGLLIAITVFATITFLPVTHEIKPAGVSLIAWMLWFLMVAAPAVGLFISARDKSE